MPSRRAVYRAALAMLAACQSRGGEPALCLDQRQDARNHALRGELEQAQALLDQVKAKCGPNSQSEIAHITKLIAEKAAARAERERESAARDAELANFPSRSFVEWATARGGDISGKLATVSCAERGAADFGFCQGERSEASNMALRYWQAQPDAYRYTLTSSQPPSCQDLGEYRQVRAWSRNGTDYELCELTNRRLRHLSALIVRAPAGYEMDLFSQSYPALDAAFERRLRVIAEP